MAGCRHHALAIPVAFSYSEALTAENAKPAENKTGIKASRQEKGIK